MEYSDKSARNWVKYPGILEKQPVPQYIKFQFMPHITLDDQFKSYLLSAYPIEESLLMRLLDDLSEYSSSSLEEFISQRHRELKRQGMKNDRIYEQIQSELAHRRFPGPDLSIRQIRRAIYG